MNGARVLSARVHVALRPEPQAAGAPCGQRQPLSLQRKELHAAGDPRGGEASARRVGWEWWLLWGLKLWFLETSNSVRRPRGNGAKAPSDRKLRNDTSVILNRGKTDGKSTARDLDLFTELADHH